MSATSALESNEDLEHVTLVRMEDVQPDRSSEMYLNNADLGSCVIENLEYENECVIDDEDSHIGSMVSIKSEDVADCDSDTAEYIVPDIMGSSTEHLKEKTTVKTIAVKSCPSRWPTLEILPGGVIKDADKYEDDTLTSDFKKKPITNNSEMVYACAKCPQKYKYLFCLVKHVKCHEDQPKKEKKPSTKIIINDTKKVDKFSNKGKIIRRIKLKRKSKNVKKQNCLNSAEHKTNLS